MCILRHISYLLKSQSSNVRSHVMKRDELNLGEGVIHSIPLIRKAIVYDFLGQLALEPTALAQLQEHADMPFALDTSTAEFIPFHAFFSVAIWVEAALRRKGICLFITTYREASES